jgi:hypothetical protein
VFNIALFKSPDGVTRGALTPSGNAPGRDLMHRLDNTPRPLTSHASTYQL